MTPKIQYTKKFSRDLRKSPDEVKTAFIDSLDLYLENPKDPLLRNHSLFREYRGYRSINVTEDWRALFRELKSGEIIRFEFLGTHDQLYNI